MRALCLFRHVRHLTSDNIVRFSIQNSHEAASIRVNHLDSIGFVNTLLALDRDGGSLARCQSDSVELWLGEDTLEGNGEPGGPCPSLEDDVSIASNVSSSDNVGLDPEAASSEDDEDGALTSSSLWTALSFVTSPCFLSVSILSPDLRRGLASRRSSSSE